MAGPSTQVNPLPASNAEADFDARRDVAAHRQMERLVKADAPPMLKTSVFLSSLGLDGILATRASKWIDRFYNPAPEPLKPGESDARD